MPLQFDKDGIQFLYPDNWQLAEEAPEEGASSISVSSPGGGYWELQIHTGQVTLEELADQAIQAMREVYPDLEAETLVEEVAGLNAQGFELSFFCLDLLITSRIRAFQKGDRTCLLTWQAENREFEELLPVFRAITTSLLDR